MHHQSRNAIQSAGIGGMMQKSDSIRVSDSETVQADDCGEGLSLAAPMNDHEYLSLLESYPIGKAVGWFRRMPWRLDFNWLLRAGPDPRPFCPLDLVRIKHSIQTGGAVMVFATEQAALDIALQAIDAELPELKVIN